MEGKLSGKRLGFFEGKAKQPPMPLRHENIAHGRQQQSKAKLAAKPANPRPVDAGYRLPVFVNKYNLEIFRNPLQLIKKSDDDTHFVCDEDVLAQLRQVEEPVCVVAATGTLRTGKSFLLNKLLQPCGGGSFDIGHTAEAVTKGIWITCRQHPTQDNTVLIILDTEGIDDPKKVDVAEDQWLFVLATLLSGVLIYNTKGNFDNNSMNKFKFLKTIKKSVTVSVEDPTDDSMVDFFFPRFSLVLRDVTLDLDSTSDEFLEKQLEYSNRVSVNSKIFNEPRILIRRYFKNRRCFAFALPCHLKEHFKNLQDEHLDKDFVQTLEQFKEYIYSGAPKTLKSGKRINGRMLTSLTESYVNSIKEQEGPCLQTAMATMAANENEYAVRKATETYSQEMKKRLSKHLPNDRGLHTYHNDCIEIALDVLKELIVIDDEQIYIQKATECFKTHLNNFKKIIDEDSLKRCRDKLSQLNMKVSKKLRERGYCHPRGYDEYMADIDSIAKDFARHEQYLGSMTKVALVEFLDGKEEEEKKVFEMVLETLPDPVDEKAFKRMSKGMVMLPSELQQYEEDEHALEKKILESMTAIQDLGLKSIVSEYDQLLRLKMVEIERTKNELSADNTYYKQLVNEYKYWKGMYDKMQLLRNPGKPVAQVGPVICNNANDTDTVDDDVLEKKQKKNVKCKIL